MRRFKSRLAVIAAFAVAVVAPMAAAGTASAAIDRTPPTVTSTTPLNGAVGVGVGIAPTAKFNENIWPSSVVATFTTGLTPVTFKTSYNSVSHLMTFTPTTALAHSKKYTVTIWTALDLSGNLMSRAYSWSFTTDAVPPPPVDNPPSVVLTASTLHGVSPLAVTFDASKSTDTDSTPIRSYSFVWGDGTSGSGVQTSPVATHTYTAPGTWTAQMTVVDTAGNAAVGSVQVTVDAPVVVDNPPVAALTVTVQTGDSPLTVLADASTSTDADLSPIATYAFDFGDGTTLPAEAGPTAQHTYAASGTYQVTVTVTDTAGKQGAATTPVTVQQAPPPSTKTTVSLTFDDADADQTTAAAQLKAHGMNGTFFINSGLLGSPGNLTPAQVAAIAADGNEIGGHTVNHVDLTLESPDQAKREICNDRAALLAMGYKVTSMAYPFGAQNATIKQDTLDCGYNSARGVSGIKSPDGCASCATAETIPPADPFLTRTPSSIKATTTLADMEGLVTQAEDHGGGWVQLVMHHVCEPGSTGCSDVYSMSPTIFGQFLDWLQTRSAQGTVVKTVDQVIGGSVQPAVDGPAYPTQPGNLVKNPSLEETSAGMPVCFDNGGYGTNTPAYATTSDAHSGSVAETLTVTAWTSGDQKLITKQDSGECSIAVTPGQRYDVGVWYKGAWSGSASADVVMFYEDSTGVWKYWKDGPAVPSTSVWSRATYVTPVVPAGATHLWFGLALVGTGTVTTDDYSAAVHVGGPNPPGTPAVSVASPTSIKVSWPIVPDASVASYTAQAFLNNVLVSQRNCTTATLTCTVSGLTTGTAYTFKVITHGTTGYGDSVYSAPSVVIKPA